ncbi:MAG: glycosyltransferase family 39 protein [Candidatus Riflebacteria bacterium]|nr:glycosyltransferase family 39 protein [Candidatus Riflebacteria bacterium]
MIWKHLWPPSRDLALFSLAFGVRIIPWLWGATHWDRILQSTDSHGYHQAAVNLLAHGTLSVSFTPPFAPDSLRTPVYPWFLAAVYGLFGVRPALAQCVIASSSVLLVDRIATRLVGRRAALVAAILLALDLPSLALSMMLLTETLAVFLLLAASLFIVNLYPPPGPGGATPDPTGRVDAPRGPAWTGVVVGLLLAACALTRPTFLFLPGVVWIALLPRRNLRAVVTCFLLLVLSFSLPLAAWMVRNRVSVGVWEFSSIQGQELLFYRVSGVMARVWAVPVAEAWARLDRESRQEVQQRGLGPAHLDRIRNEIGRRYLRAHPLEYVPVMASGMVKAWVGLSIFDLLKQFDLWYRGVGLFGSGGGAERTMRERWAALSAGEQLAIGFEVIYRLIVLALGSLGLVLVVIRRDGATLALVVPHLSYISLTCGTVLAYHRFRAPLVPYWCILAGVGLSWLAALWTHELERGR